MSNKSSFNDDDPSDEAEFAELAKLLNNEDVWAEPSPDTEDRLLAAIANEREAANRPSQGTGEPHGDTEPVINLEERRARRAGGRRFWPLAAAAAVLIVAISGAAGFVLTRANQPDYTVALAPTDLAPRSEAVARIDERPNGARLVVDLDGLDPAPPGSFYEVWLVRENPRTVISAGTFHMRGSTSGEIEFWSGVSPLAYPIITITLESEADPAAPGELVMRGEVDLT